MIRFCGCLQGNSASEETDLLFAVRPEHVDDVKKTKFRIRPGRTLSERKWKSVISEDGHVDMAAVIRRVQRGGVHPSIRGAVWEFLLGCYDPNSTYFDRNQLKDRRREQYGRWKTECQMLESTIGSGRYITKPIIGEDGQPIQEGDDPQEPPAGPPSQDPVVKWKRLLHQIGLDVVRTDRALVFYESEDNLAKLWNVLAIYAWIDKEIGYCQGMSDLCSPLVILFENEADAFWCFERIMCRVRGNFKSSVETIGIRLQLSVLAKVMKAVDPKLHQHLEELDGGEYLFAVRMLMALFRREFSIIDAMYLWEMMWAMEYNPNIFILYEKSNTNTETLPKPDDNMLKQYGKFERENMTAGYKDQDSPLAVFFVASILKVKNKRFITEAKGLDDVIKILNDTMATLDIKKACDEALKVQRKYLSAKQD